MDIRPSEMAWGLRLWGFMKSFLFIQKTVAFFIFAGIQFSFANAATPECPLVERRFIALPQAGEFIQSPSILRRAMTPQYSKKMSREQVSRVNGYFSKKYQSALKNDLEHRIAKLPINVRNKLNVDEMVERESLRGATSYYLSNIVSKPIGSGWVGTMQSFLPWDRTHFDFFGTSNTVRNFSQWLIDQGVLGCFETTDRLVKGNVADVAGFISQSGNDFMFDAWCCNEIQVRTPEEADTFYNSGNNPFPLSGSALKF